MSRIFNEEKGRHKKKDDLNLAEIDLFVFSLYDQKDKLTTAFQQIGEGPPLKR